MSSRPLTPPCVPFGTRRFNRISARTRTEPGNRNAEKEIIFRFLTEDRNVKYLVHFTPLINIPSILRCGILSREELEKLQIDACCPDDKRLDGHNNYSSLSISFPNYRQFYAKRNQSFQIYAVLIIVPEVILDLPLHAVSYLPDNAASNRVSKNVKIYANYEWVKKLFGDDIWISGKRVSREELCIPSFYTSNPQAEVFISEKIAPEYIRAIAVANESEKLQLEELLPYDTWKPKIICDYSFFDKRLDYEFWKTETKEYYMGGLI